MCLRFDDKYFPLTFHLVVSLWWSPVEIAVFDYGDSFVRSWIGRSGLFFHSIPQGASGYICMVHMISGSPLFTCDLSLSLYTQGLDNDSLSKKKNLTSQRNFIHYSSLHVGDVKHAIYNKMIKKNMILWLCIVTLAVLCLVRLTDAQADLEFLCVNMYCKRRVRKILIK